MTVQIHAARIDAIRAAAKRLQNYPIVPDWADDEFVHGMEVLIIETFGSDAEPGYEMGALHEEITAAHHRIRLEGEANQYADDVVRNTDDDDLGRQQVWELVKQAYLVGILKGRNS